MEIDVDGEGRERYSLDSEEYIRARSEVREAKAAGEVNALLVHSLALNRGSCHVHSDFTLYQRSLPIFEHLLTEQRHS